MREQPEIRYARELARCNPHQIGIGDGDEAGQRRNPKPSPHRGKHVALGGAPHDDRSLPGDEVAPAREMHVRSLVGKADDAVTLPFVAPFGQTPPRGIVTRSIEAGAEATDLAADQIRKRAKEWGPGGIDTRFGAAWAASRRCGIDG